MIKLKTLLLECFYNSQWLDILQKYPKIVELFKNDPITKKNGYFLGSDVNWNDLTNIASIISYYGGHCNLNPSDFNYNAVKDFLYYDVWAEDSPTDSDITKETLDKILPLIKDYFKKYGNNTTKETELNWIKTEYDRIVNKHGKEEANKWINFQLKMGDSFWKRLKLTNKEIKDFIEI
jgi:hypothetical protein